MAFGGGFNNSSRTYHQAPTYHLFDGGITLRPFVYVGMWCCPVQLSVSRAHSVRSQPLASSRAARSSPEVYRRAFRLFMLLDLLRGMRSRIFQVVPLDRAQAAAYLGSSNNKALQAALASRIHLFLGSKTRTRTGPLALDRHRIIPLVEAVSAAALCVSR